MGAGGAAGRLGLWVLAVLREALDWRKPGVGPRADARGGWGRLGSQAPDGGRDGSGSPETGGPAGPVIRQRENAIPEERPAAEEQRGGQHRPGRARVVRAGPAGAAPRPTSTTPRWPKLALHDEDARVGGGRAAAADAAGRGGIRASLRRGRSRVGRPLAQAGRADHRGRAQEAPADGDEGPSLPEPADRLALPELSVPPAPPDTASDPGEVYVITSAKPAREAWGDGFVPRGGWGDRCPFLSLAFNLCCLPGNSLPVLSGASP